MKPWIIVQARATSSRLPRKIFMDLGGRTLLEQEICRLQRVKGVSGILLATTRNSTDDETVEIAKKCGIPFYRGDELDVLSRYFEAALFCGAKNIVRITSDCPLIDAAVVEAVIERFFESRADYTSNTLKRTFPRGLDTEIFTFDALRAAFYEAKKEPEREHVTPFIRNQGGRFSCTSFESSKDFSSYRWTVDTQEDLNLVRKIYEAAGLTQDRPQNYFAMEQVLEILEQNPTWAEINAHIEQKKE